MRRQWLRAACAAHAVLLMALPCASQAAGNDPACPPDAREMPIEALYGDWQARIEGQPGSATLRLQKHPDYAGVRGTLVRDGASPQAPAAQVAGDIDDEGMLSLDESADGRSISGVWLGALQPASCGREFKGVWRNADNDTTHPFTLKKIGR